MSLPFQSSLARFAALTLLLGGLALTAERPESTPARPPLPPLPPPSLPPAPTPIDRFRTLLALSAAEREQELASRTAPQRAYLERWLAEFDRLPPAEREWQLRWLTLRHHLLPLLRASPFQRAEELRRVPAEYRTLLRDRLAAWDQLAPREQQALLDNESLFAGLALVPQPVARQAEDRVLGALPPEPPVPPDPDPGRFHTLPPAERQKLTRHLESFLSLSDREQQKTLAHLDQASRQRAARLIERFDGLPAAQQSRSVEALRRFQALPAPERERFLRQAARWQAMSPEERAAWRRLVAALPPAPPGFK